MAKRNHSRLSPSGAYRWMACPGSPRIIAAAPAQTSVYADEGTAAHQLGEYCLTFGQDPSEFAGEKITVNGGAEFLADEAMVLAVRVYVDTIKRFAPQGAIDGGVVEFHVEVPLDLSQYFPGLQGHSDAIVADWPGKAVHVFDFKYGMVPVAAQNNAQLMLYGLGALHFLEAKAALANNRGKRPGFDFIFLHVIQPRVFLEEASWLISRMELDEWAAGPLKAAIDKTEDPAAPLAVGGHCRFCAGAPICPELAKNSLALAREGFGAPVPAPPAPETLSLDAIREILGAKDRIESWLAGVQAYAQGRLEAGAEIPGWKLVAKRSIRKWKDEAETKRVLAPLLGEKLYKPAELISPTKATEILKDDLAELIVKPDNGVTMAPESDRRPALPPPAVRGFAEQLDLMK